MTAPLTVGSLFSGIGGLDLGLERAGMRVIWQAEIDPYCCQVLRQHWPDVPNLGDVSRIEWSDVVRPDVICGGYPCQPFSLAGARAGTDDRRHLWPYVRDALRVLRPRFALLENVAGHLSLGFDRVLGDLAEIGFDAEWDCIPAAAVGASHRRDRVFLVAYPDDVELRHDRRRGSPEPEGRHVPGESRHDGPAGRVADPARAAAAHSDRQLDHDADPGPVPAAVADPEGVAVGPGLRASGAPRLGWGRPRDCGSTGDAWTVEPDVGRVAHGVPARMDRLAALGNAVVPAVAEYLGRMIVEAAS